MTNALLPPHAETMLVKIFGITVTRRIGKIVFFCISHSLLQVVEKINIFGLERGKSQMVFFPINIVDSHWMLVTALGSCSRSAFLY